MTRAAIRTRTVPDAKSPGLSSAAIIQANGNSADPGTESTGQVVSDGPIVTLMVFFKTDHPPRQEIIECLRGIL